MKTGFFHLLSDCKTVKEISSEEWVKIAMQEREKGTHTKLICRVHPTELYFVKGKKSMWIPRRQLDQILGES